MVVVRPFSCTMYGESWFMVRTLGPDTGDKVKRERGTGTC